MKKTVLKLPKQKKIKRKTEKTKTKNRKISLLVSLTKMLDSLKPTKKKSKNKIQSDHSSNTHFSHLGKMHSIKTKFTCVFLCFALIPLICLCIVYTLVAKHALKTTSSTLNLEIVRQATNNIDTQLTNLESNLTNFAISDLLNSQGAVKALHKGDRSSQVSAVLNINKLISSFKVTSNQLKEVCFISNGYDQAIGSISPYNTDELKGLITEDAQKSYCWSTPEKFSGNSALVVKTFTDITNHTEYTILCKVDLSDITTYLSSSSLLDNARIYLVTNDNGIIYSNDESTTTLSAKIAAGLNSEELLSSFNSDNSLISYSTLSNGWKIIVETPNRSLTSQLSSATIIIFLLFIVIIALSALLGTIYGKHFSKPIINLGQLMKKAEEGDLTVSATISGNDEITALCQSFNQMMLNIKALINQTQDVIGHAMDSSETLRHSTGHSVTAIKELAIAVSEIAEGTTTQALNSQKSTQDMSDLSISMEKVTAQTNNLLDHTDGARAMIENATSTMNSLTETMNSSLEISTHITSSVKDLSHLNQNIEDVMKLVDSISEETNLLALNASIEAARVGEAGRGFAVVANEVRRLADQSKSSTLSVRSTLSTITAKMNETVSLANESQQIIKNQESVVEDTHKLFYDIVSILSDMTSELHTVNTSIQDMEQLKAVMVTQIEDIASVTQESAATTEEVSSLATEQQTVISKLSDLSDNLTHNMQRLAETINAFKVK